MLQNSRKRVDMSVTELERLQEELNPKEDLSQYEGHWVALREGRVVAVADDPVSLRAHPDVKDDDGILFVGDPSSGYYL
jgi:hypothetical protein